MRRKLGDRHQIEERGKRRWFICRVLRPLILLLLAVGMSLLVSNGTAEADTEPYAWHKSNNEWWYGNSKWYAKSQWKKFSGKWYYFDRKGYAVHSGWRWISGKLYFFDKDLSMVSSEYRDGYWLSANGQWTYKPRASWKLKGRKWMYSDTSGWTAKKHWYRIDGIDFYFRSDGIMTTSVENMYGLPEYYRDPLYKTTAALEEQGEDWTSFVIVTDTHGGWNCQCSQGVVNFLLDHSKTERCFMIGDYSARLYGTGVEVKRYFRELTQNRDQVFVTLGNHERTVKNEYDTGRISVIYDMFMKDKVQSMGTGLKGNPKDYYYYFDDRAKKLRYLVLNTNNVSLDQYAMTNEELNWIRNEAVVLPGNDWNLVVLGHTDIDSSLNLPYTSSKADRIASALSKTNGKIVGYFCGHEHLDRTSVVNGKFYQTILLNDYLDLSQGRVWHELSEQAVTVVSVNTKTGAVVMRRIGADSKDRTKSYNYRKIPSGEEP